MSRQDQLDAHLVGLRGKLAESAAQVGETLARSRQQERALHELVAEANDRLSAVEPEPEKAAEEVRADERADRYWGERRDAPEPEADDPWADGPRRFGYYGED